MCNENEKPLPPAPGAGAPEPTPLGRFGHHPDPAIDFCVEVEEIQTIAFDRKLAIQNSDDGDLEARIDRALRFIVGGDQGAIAAKAELRKIADEIKAAPGAGEAREGALVPQLADEVVASLTPHGREDDDSVEVSVRQLRRLLKWVSEARALTAAPPEREGGER